MPVTKRITSQLLHAMRRRQLVRLSRRFEEWTIRGYVLDVGPRFFLLALISEHLWFDGFECFRISDVKDLKRDPYAAFVEAALKKRSEQRPKKPHVSLASIDKLLLSASQTYPLVTIHREQVDPDVCWIGRVSNIKNGYVTLREIDPGAKWESGTTKYRLSEITHVNFGADYEDALYLVGGEPPSD